jgi:hypothetical protein
VGFLKKAPPTIGQGGPKGLIQRVKFDIRPINKGNPASVVNVLHRFENRKAHPSVPNFGSPLVRVAKGLEVVSERILLTIYGIVEIFLKAHPNGNGRLNCCLHIAKY